MTTLILNSLFFYKFLKTYSSRAGIVVKAVNIVTVKTFYRNPFSKETREELEMEILKVSAKSNPNSVAGALAGVLRERGAAEIQAIGAGALNQAVKAVAIARGFVAPSGMDLICIPAFTDIMIDGEERTAIKLIVEPR
ncbi:Stage V sporulation protein S [Geobacillus thermodenitrificans NG80-2]|jgi:stage V sporulation protein S|uniref:Stage V sporulation protein S n=6 Tax=Bacillales TaxID=1385 RepID=A4IMH3_GEOTN|nr:Stage V sporulation protein S [Geobacillus thermodenitrificans NG80-2]